MEKKSEINEKVQEFSKRITDYATYKELIGNEAFSRLQELVEDFRRNAENALDENRLMRIGIIGQIKRGKSSFLNALFFDGNDILPKAATPMTAALTRIIYSESPEASVEYYSVNEWNEIKRKSREAEEIQNKIELYRANQKSKSKGLFRKEIELQLPPELSVEQKSCLELVKFAEKNAIDVDNYLGKTEKLSEANSINELVKKLENYVGSKGIYTPIVKNTTLLLNIPSLKNIEIVDTPGMNDPIISRARRTEEFMGQCDVIFLLSHCSQFLDITDMRLLAQNIPSKGIRNIILIGSLFDSVLLDEYEKYPSLGVAITKLTEKKIKEAEDNFNAVKNQIKKESLSKALESAFPPVFVSSMCYNISKHYSNLNEEEKFVLENLNNMEKGFTFNPDLLNSLANFEEIQEKLDKVKENKEEILSKRFTHIKEGFIDCFKTETTQIKKTLLQKRDNLENGDIEELSQKQHSIIQKLNSGTVKINGVFERHMIDAERNFADILLDIDEASVQARNVQSNTRTETQSYQVSNSKWWNPFSWGTTRTEYTTVSYAYANVHEAVERIEEYVINGKRLLVKAVKDIIHISKFRKDIVDNVTNLFDFSDDNFDSDDIIIPVENAVNRITIPVVEIDVEKHIDKIRDQFKSSEVRNDEINTLRVESARVVDLITKDIKLEIQATLKRITGKMSDIKESFIPSLTMDLNSMVNELAEQIKNREAFLKKYYEIIELLNN